MNCTDYSKVTRQQYDKVMIENESLHKELKEAKKDVTYYKNLARQEKAAKEKAAEKHKSELAEKDAVIKELKNRLAHELALKNHDGTNTGLPTSQTPIGKKKRIPNSRTKSGKAKGGQKGHPKHTMKKPDKQDIDKTICHRSDADTVCPVCGSGNYVYTGKKDIRYEIDIEVKVNKTKHVYYEYQCCDCGRVFKMPIKPNLKAECQYGSNVQAIALSLMNTGNVPMNKVRMILSGMTNDEIKPSEGYIAKLQKRGSKALQEFKSDLKQYAVQQPLLYWDDTVAMMNKQRGCIRFYGNEKIAYYTAHLHKDLSSLEEDNLLILLTKETTVMHDHNKVNYNERWSFLNIECNQHLERDIQKSADDSHHYELIKLKDLISSTIHDRKELIAKGVSHFSENRINKFNRSLEEILQKAEKENASDPDSYGAPFEKTLIKRIRKYRENYFLWVLDFNIPTTDNLSERALRCVKSHMKISGQFSSETTAAYYADLKTYIETCRRNNINETYALQRLCDGNPITVAEIFSTVAP